MIDRWTDRLSEYIDGELPAAERAELELHVASCADCTTALHELRRVAARGRSLADRPPTADLWPAIAARVSGVHPIGAATPVRGWSRRVPLTLRQLAAAGLVLAAVSAGATAWFLQSETVTVVDETGARSDTTAPPALDVSAVALIDPTYQAAIADLELVIAEGEGRLRPETIRTLQANLLLINAAIADARRALADDPASGYLHQYISEQMVRKLELLRATAAIVSARS